MLLLIHGVAALSTRTIAPPAAPVLDNIVHLAQHAVAAPEFLDPRDGTWADCPVGGAAERDGSWLDGDTRAALKAALDGLAARDRHGLAARLAGEGSASLEVFSGERYCVRVLALEAGGAAVRETHPSGTVVLSRCVAGRCSAVPMLRLKNDQPWEPRVSSARTRRRDGGCWTALGGPPREISSAGSRPVWKYFFWTPRAIDAISSHHCVCSMAWRFHAIDATLSPSPRLLDGVEVHEGLSQYSQDNLTHCLISTQSAPLPRCFCRAQAAGRAKHRIGRRH